MIHHFAIFNFHFFRVVVDLEQFTKFLGWTLAVLASGFFIGSISKKRRKAKGEKHGKR